MVQVYLDENIEGAIGRELTRHGIDVLTVQQDGYTGRPDPDVMDRATELERVLLTHDDDLLAEATQRQLTSVSFSGVIFAHPKRVTIGQCVRDVEFLAQAGRPEDFANQVYYLPL